MARRSRSEVSEVIRAVPLFSQLTKGQLRSVATQCVQEEYEAGKEILKQFEEAQLMVAITGGSAKVVRDGRTIAQVGPGDVVGEMALIDGMRRSAAVVSETPVEAIVLHRTAFLKLLQENPSLSVKLMASLSARLREANKRLSALG